jgi:sRNA-binding carbon storage regulator CsrA
MLSSKGVGTKVEKENISINTTVSIKILYIKENGLKFSIAHFKIHRCYTERFFLKKINK